MKALIRFKIVTGRFSINKIDSLFAAVVSQIGIVVGLEKGQTIEHVQSRYRGWMHCFHFIAILHFAETNNIHSVLDAAVQQPADDSVHVGHTSVGALSWSQIDAPTLKNICAQFGVGAMWPALLREGSGIS